MFLQKMGKYSDVGLLLIRIVLGGMFMYYGGPKLFEGPHGWVQFGGAMPFLGVNFALSFWGFLAAFSMFAGGLCVILGLFSASGRLSCSSRWRSRSTCISGKVTASSSRHTRWRMARSSWGYRWSGPANTVLIPY